MEALVSVIKATSFTAEKGIESVIFVAITATTAVIICIRPDC